jgi:hypothetical protein
MLCSTLNKFAVLAPYDIEKKTFMKKIELKGRMRIRSCRSSKGKGVHLKVGAEGKGGYAK